MAGKKSWKGKKQYASYKTENRVHYNKIRKLERHCKDHPEDEKGKENLAKLKSGSTYTGRKAPREAGSNRTLRLISVVPPEHIDTPAEQLSKLLGIPIPKPRVKSKPKVTHKRRKNVKSKTVPN